MALVFIIQKKTIKANLKSKTRLERIDFLTQEATNLFADLFIFTRPLTAIDEDYFEKLFNRIIEKIYVIELNLLGSEIDEIRSSLEVTRNLVFESLKTKTQESNDKIVNLEYVVDPDLKDEFENLRELLTEYIKDEWKKAEKTNN